MSQDHMLLSEGHPVLGPPLLKGANLEEDQGPVTKPPVLHLRVLRLSLFQLLLLGRGMLRKVADDLE